MSATILAQVRSCLTERLRRLGGLPSSPKSPACFWLRPCPSPSRVERTAEPGGGGRWGCGAFTLLPSSRPPPCRLPVLGRTADRLDRVPSCAAPRGGGEPVHPRRHARRGSSPLRGSGRFASCNMSKASACCPARVCQGLHSGLPRAGGRKVGIGFPLKRWTPTCRNPCFSQRFDFHLSAPRAWAGGQAGGGGGGVSWVDNNFRVRVRGRDCALGTQPHTPPGGAQTLRCSLFWRTCGVKWTVLLL